MLKNCWHLCQNCWSSENEIYFENYKYLIQIKSQGQIKMGIFIDFPEFDRVGF